jgi:hypothetical protein
MKGFGIQLQKLE